MINLKERIDEIEKGKGNSLIIQYIKSSMNSEEEKVQYFQNILSNSLLNKQSSISEDKSFFYLVEELSLKQIDILKIFYDSQNNIDYFLLRHETKYQITAEKIYEKYKQLNVDHIKQICLSLMGKGLLEDWGIGRFDYDGPKSFIINQYTKKLFEYVIKR